MYVGTLYKKRFLMELSNNMLATMLKRKNKIKSRGQKDSNSFVIVFILREGKS